MKIKPHFVTDELGIRWLRPGMSHIHMAMLGLTMGELWEAAEKGEELEIEDDVWESVQSADLHWEEMSEGGTTRLKVSAAAKPEGPSHNTSQ